MSFSHVLVRGHDGRAWRLRTLDSQGAFGLNPSPLLKATIAYRGF